MAGKDLLSKLADAGEDAIQRLTESPGADRLTGVAHVMRDRMDELQKRVRGLDELEKRVTELEMRLDELTGTQRPTRTGAPGKKKTAAARPAAAKAASASRKAPAKKSTTKAPSGKAAPKGSTGTTGGSSPG
jgi:hypothetical protein